MAIDTAVETTETSALTEDQRAWIDGMRAMCDFLEANPDYLTNNDGLVVNRYVSDKEGLAKAARDFGHCEKVATESSFYSVIKRFGPHKVDAFASRAEVCERIQTGVKTVTEKVLPEGVELVEVTREVPVYEYKCPKSLLEAGS